MSGEASLQAGSQAVYMLEAGIVIVDNILEILVYSVENFCFLQLKLPQKLIHRKGKGEKEKPL